mmetsp:Transcript_7764/g.10821  ORF Transcript_7764/g.10821 Transcript_7764/m.10821 type:complete len:249 (-) Transcript_7764:160-906(-)
MEKNGDAWKVVERRGNRRKRQEYRKCGLEKPIIKAVRPVGLKQGLNKRCHDLVQSDWWHQTAASMLQSILPVWTSGRIVCYGLGSVFESRNAQWQLALALVLVERRTTPCKLEIHDPVLSLEEKVFLTEELGCLEASPVEELILEDDATTLVFMPHCPAEVYANLLSALDPSRLGRLLLLGNSLTAYQTRTSERSLEPQFCRALGCLRSEYNLDPGRTDPELERAFSDTALHVFVDEEATIAAEREAT